MLARLPMALLLTIALAVTSLLAPAPAAAQPPVPQLAEFRSAHVEMTIRLETDAFALSVPAAGDFELDPATRSMRMRLQMTAMGQSFEMIMVGQRVYIRQDPSAPWQYLETRQPDARTVANMVPAQQIANLQRAVAFRNLGPESVEGVATTKWAIEYDTQQLADVFMMFPGMTGGQVPNPMTDPAVVAQILRDAKMEAQVWIANDTGYLKRLQIDMQFTVPARTTAGTATTSRPQTLRQSIVMTFSRYNESFNIVAPANAVPLRAPGPGMQPTAQIQMPRGPSQAGMLPTRMPRAGELPLGPGVGLGFGLVAFGLALRRRGRADSAPVGPPAGDPTR